MRTTSHVQYDLQYYIVWTTKYRYRVVEGKIAQRLKELIIQGCRARRVNIIKGSIGTNHIHIPVLKKRYWGQHLWSSGYFCRSVGTVTQEMIKEYIENQKDDDNENFKILK